MVSLKGVVMEILAETNWPDAAISIVTIIGGIFVFWIIFR